MYSPLVQPCDGSQLSKLLSCVDSFREDLISRGLEENIYRV